MSTITEVKEYPILFTSDMVRAILDGRKTQTRRVMKPQPEKDDSGFWRYAGAGWSRDDFVPVAPGHPLEASCPYGRPGSELWVRETFALREPCDNKAPSECMEDEAVWFKADNNELTGNAAGRWRPSIHMPRWASRVQLTVTDIRVERVQGISIDDVWAEGVQIPTNNGNAVISLTDKYTIATYMEGTVSEWEQDDFFRAHFAKLWDELNADRDQGQFAWESNPWVWVIDFEVREVRS